MTVSDLESQGSADPHALTLRRKCLKTVPTPPHRLTSDDHILHSNLSGEQACFTVEHPASTKRPQMFGSTIFANMI